MMILQTVIWIWGIACAVALIQGLLLGLNTWEHRRFARRRRQDDRPSPQSCRVALLAPCKGLDLDLESNLRHLLTQDYANYEVVFIVESEDDPALPIISRLIREESSIAARIVVAGRADSTGQKIHNLTVAVRQLSPQVEILAFVDSDVCPAPEWLGRLVSRLYRPGSGTVTGYRWFAPSQATLANCLLYSINSSIAALLGTAGQYIVWGGSWAIRKADFDALKILDRWHGTISDDLVATVAIKAGALPIEFEPNCMTASPMNYSPREFLRFLRRQHLIGRIYAPAVWYQSLCLLLISSCAVLTATVLTGVGLLAGAAWTGWPAGFLLAWYGLQIFRGLLRRDLARIYVRHWTRAMDRAAWFDVFGSPLTLLLNTVVMAGACFGDRIVWRGIVYDLDRQGRLTRVLQPAQAAPLDRVLRFDGPESARADTRQPTVAHHAGEGTA